MIFKSAPGLPHPAAAIALGTGDGFWDGPGSDDDKVALIQRAIDLGLNLIDTAEVYGDGIAERLVSRAIQGRRDSVIVATKFSPEHSHRDGIAAALDRSLTRLRTDVVDIYQLHWPNPSVPFDETLDGLARVLQQGKARTAGLCNVSRRQFERAKAALGDGLSMFQTEYNLGERSVERDGTMGACARTGSLLAAYSPLDQGRITGGLDRGAEVLQRVAVEHGRSTAQIALGWIVSHAPAVALTRTNQARHLESNVAAGGIELTAEQRESISRAFQPIIRDIPTARIMVSPSGEFNHKIYTTKEEAIENRLGFVPSPVELAESVRDGDFLKPVRVVPAPAGTAHGFDYELIAGRIRYWAWVIAHDGQVPIPCYVREDVEVGTT